MLVIRDRLLDELQANYGLGKQSPKFKIVKEALDRFINEFRKLRLTKSHSISSNADLLAFFKMLLEIDIKDGRLTGECRVRVEDAIADLGDGEEVKTKTSGQSSPRF
ncbi:MAG: hypothetical protein KME46_33550 [Brasilonema angustatum HA4187-MV1]|nr:hypothetical protein [Brasilonema angustatum HA4187-MV1]